jgi:hypothetical protein
VQNYWNQIRFLIIRLSWLYVLFFVCRWVFFLLNKQAFQGVGVSEFFSYSFYGLIFDSFSILVANSLFVLLGLIPWKWFYSTWYQKTVKAIFISTNTLFLLSNCIDCAYYAFTKKRSTMDLFNQLGGQTDVWALLPSFFRDFWYVLLLLLALIFVVFKTYRYATDKNVTPYTYSVKNSLLFTLTFLFCAGLCVLGIRGGLGRVPISPVDAGKYGPTQHAAILFNSPFTIIKSNESTSINRLAYFDANTLKQLCNPFTQVTDSLSFTNENVVVVILESFGKEYTALSGQKSYTPFLDSLMKWSLVYTNAFANASKSIEGIPAILSGMPHLMESPYINSPYCNNVLSSFASLLKTKNYETAFFHGGFNGTMNFDGYAKGAGYANYFGKREYGNDKDFDGTWGIWDEPFLQFSIQKMNGFKQPFHSAIFTLSSHHPYKIPEKYKNKFEKGKYENHECIQYADYALKRFFETAKTTTWFKNTLFVITADHTSLSGVPFYSNYPGALSIPILFYRADNSLKQENKRLFQHISILPKAMQLLGFKKPIYNLGNEEMSLFYYSGTYFCCDDSLCYEFGNNKINRIVNYKRDSLLGTDLMNKYPELQAKQENKIKAILQTFTNDLIEDKMK